MIVTCSKSNPTMKRADYITRGGWYSGYIVILQYYFEAITVLCKICSAVLSWYQYYHGLLKNLCMHWTIQTE